jgi:3-oxoacyl-[acyl-carrier-protein] synthase II
VITGAGVVSPIGNCFEDFLAGIEQGRKGIGTMKSFDTAHLPCALGAEVKAGPDAARDSAVDAKELFIRQAMAELLRGNAFFAASERGSRVLNLGAGLDYFDLQNYTGSQASQTGKWQQYSRNTHLLAGKLAELYEIEGGYSVNVSACVAASQAIGLSYRMLKNTSAPLVIVAGGFDSMLNPLHYLGFYKLGAFSNWQGSPAEACRPFDKNRSGLVLGEGAAVFLLQKAADAAPDNILAEIAGYASTMDAYLVTDPEPSGKLLAQAALAAIKEAGITPDEIDGVHLHGTGTIKNDLAETAALKIIFGKKYSSIPVFSLKGQIGHLIGACGALELAGAIYSILRQKMPPTVNFTQADPEIGLRVIKDQPLEMKINYLLKLNAAFGGQNTAIVVKRHGT